MYLTQLFSQLGLPSGQLERGEGQAALCEGGGFAGLFEFDCDPGGRGGAVLVAAGGCDGGVEFFRWGREGGDAWGFGGDVLRFGILPIAMGGCFQWERLQALR